MSIDVAKIFYTQLAETTGVLFSAPQRPEKLLAHYTSIDTLEKILTTREVWLANPLFMNDHEEMRFMFNAARDIFISSTIVKDACGDERYKKVRETYLQHYDYFDEQYALDVYIFCLSEHDHDDFDGTLSMWRAYARNGNGGAIVFDLNKLDEEVHDTPLYVAKVRYRSTPERLEWIHRIVKQWSEYISSHTLDETELSHAVYFVFRIFTILALTTKHKGFREEAEWRVIYSPSEEDNELMKSYFTHTVTDRGVEPKLRLPISPSLASPVRR